MKPFEEIILGREQPVIMLLLVGELGWKPRNAMLVAAFLQIVAILLLISAIVMFAEWRFGPFEQLGCKAYCQCVQRFGNITYTF